MKKMLFILLLAGVTCYGQTENSFLQPNKNRTEVKVNGFSFAYGIIDFEIERTLNENSSFGVSFFSRFADPDPTYFDYDNGISGFYRYYLSKKYASGLFLEGFGMYHSTRGFQNKQLNNFLIGLGIGYKHVFKNGIILQAHFGIGRNLFDSGQDKINGKMGISIGYRF
jgi:hypothetical protein